MATLGGVLDPTADLNWSGTHTFSGRVVESGGATRLYGTVAPVSGPAGTGYLVAANGSIYLNTSSKVLYFNEGSAASPYWTPYAPETHPNMLSWHCDFRDFIGKAHADTAAVSILAGTGLRI